MFDVITIGTSTRDAFLRSGSFKLLKQKGSHAIPLECVPFGTKLEVEDVHFSTGGAATNAAVTFARQGFSVSAVTRVGDDVSGDEIRRNILREGIDGSHIIVDQRNKTAYSMILLHSAGERSILVYRGACSHWERADFYQKPLKAKWFYVSSVGGDFKVLGEIIKLAKKQNIRIAFNPGAQELKHPHMLVPFLYSIDVLIMNREEGARFTGVPVENEQVIFKRIDELEPGIFVLTDGPKGVWVSDGRNVFRAGTFKEKELVDRTGAGDAFGSGFVSGILRRITEKSKGAVNRAEVKDLGPADIVYAIRLGSANATSKIEGLGAKFGLLTKHEFDRGLRWQNLSIKVDPLQ